MFRRFDEKFQKVRISMAFEFSQKGIEKIQRVENRYVLVEDGKVSGLEYVDISSNHYCTVKRALDLCISAVGILVLLIPMAIIASIVYIDDPGEIIFKQYRVGRNGRQIKVYKFRTMKMYTPKYLSTMELTDADKYITRIGHILRRLSVDELPQLFNVLKGDMSLVGPRPLISSEYEIHEMRMRYGVYNIRPGISGLAQINGRDTVSPVDKVHWDVKYLENFGLTMDIKIIFATVPKILSGVGVVEGCKYLLDGKMAVK